MTPLDIWVARANAERLRLMINRLRDEREKAKLEALLQDELKKIRAAEASER